MAIHGPYPLALADRSFRMLQIARGIVQHHRLRAGRQVEAQDRQRAGIVEIHDIARLHVLRQHFRGNIPARLGLCVVIGCHIGEQQHRGHACKAHTQPWRHEFQQGAGPDARQNGERGGTPQNIARQQNWPPD